jgi:hypothetical protein
MSDRTEAHSALNPSSATLLLTCYTYALAKKKEGEGTLRPDLAAEKKVTKIFGQKENCS